METLAVLVVILFLALAYMNVRTSMAVYRCRETIVQSNKGSAGIDGMTVDDLPAFLKQHWIGIRAQLLDGAYPPQPVKQVMIPKPGGGERKLGIPTVVDRLIQQALLQVLQPEWDQMFSHFSFGFRPNRFAYQAVKLSQHYALAHKS